MKKEFAKGICFDKLFIIFLIGSIIGSVYEQVLNLIVVYSKTGNIVWEYRRGVIYGPFNIVYGIGAVIITYLLVDKNKNDKQTFLNGCLLGGGIEYIVSYIQETFTQTLSWDYSNKFLNINGRTTLPYMVVWGLFSLLFVKYVYPFVSNLIERIPYNLGKLITKIMVIFMCIDMSISWSALIRQSLRRNSIPPLTKYGVFLDKYYPDEFLKKYYPNMGFKEK